MVQHKSSLPTGRPAQRTNGVRRRETILDSAAEIISESGLSALTLHAVAKRAGSSIGSMYHFFGDKNQLIDALRTRHREASSEWFANLHEADASHWQSVSARQIIDDLFGRAIVYYSQHPYAIQLHDLTDDESVTAFIQRLETVLRLRLGDEIGAKTAQALYAISTGTLAYLVDPKNSAQRPLIDQIPAALTAYLEQVERAEADAQMVENLI